MPSALANNDPEIPELMTRVCLFLQEVIQVQQLYCRTAMYRSQFTLLPRPGLPPRHAQLLACLRGPPSAALGCCRCRRFLTLPSHLGPPVALPASARLPPPPPPLRPPAPPPQGPCRSNQEALAGTNLLASCNRIFGCIEYSDKPGVDSRAVNASKCGIKVALLNLLCRCGTVMEGARGGAQPAQVKEARVVQRCGGAR